MISSVAMKILGISGSLRRESFNTRLLHDAMALGPDGVSIEPFDLAPIPLYNEDVRTVGYPPDVARFRDAIRAADALLVVSPEYNFSIPGVLKNAIDWASRPPDQPLADKPAAIMGVSTGLSGTLRMQYHLRQVLNGLNARLVNHPEVTVRSAAEKFAANGGLTDEATRQIVQKLVSALVEWTNRLKK